MRMVLDLPAKTGGERQTLLIARLSLELQADVQHRISLVSDLAAPLALDVALKQTCECRMNDTYAV